MSSGLGGAARVALAVMVLSAASARAADWPFHRQNYRGDGNPGEPLTAAQAQTLTQQWVFKDVGWNYANPIVVGNTIYLTAGEGQLHALDATTGHERWAHRVSIVGPFPCLPQSQAKGPIGAPAVVGNDVFMPGADGFVYDFDGPTGAIKWKTQIADVKVKGEFLWTSGFPLHGKVYFGISADIDCLMPPGRVVALDQATGQVVGTWWGGGPSHQPGAGVWDQPAYDPVTNRMFLTTGTIANGLVQSQEPWADAFVAIDPETMQTVDSFAPIGASFSADFDFGAGPTLYDTQDGRHFVAATNKNGYVYALNRDNLAAGVLWTYQISAPGASPDLGESSIVPAAFANGLLFVGGGKTRDGFSGAVAALDGATGRAQWIFHPQGFVLGGIIATGNVVIVGTAIPNSLQGGIYVLDQQTGAVLFQKSIGAVLGSPTWSNGVLYVPDLTGALYAFNVPGGTGGGGGGPPPPPPPPPPGSSFSDDFNRSALGSSWTVAHGSFADNGAAAIGSSPQSYMFWTGTPAADAPVSIDLATNAATYVGVLARAQPSAPDVHHYAAYVGPDGGIGLARRDSNAYSYLAFGPKLAAGTHRLGLTAFGANPVTLSVTVDGVEVIHATDSSASSLTTTGLAGLFDYNGKSQPLDNFAVGTGSPGGGGGGSDGGTDAGTPADGGTGSDAGTPTDGGTGSDAGTPADGGTGSDAGTPADGGTGSDAGTPADGGSGGGTGSVTIASDDFTTSGPLEGWHTWNGGFTVSSGEAVSSASRSYATKGSAVAGDVTVSAIVSPGGGMSYYGLIARGLPGSAWSDHYAAWVNSDGTVHVGRANNWGYSYLQDAPTALQGSHKLTLKVQGTGPVHLSVFVDDQPLLDVMDSSPKALTGAGVEGIFSWQGAGPAFQHWVATQP